MLKKFKTFAGLLFISFLIITIIPKVSLAGSTTSSAITVSNLSYLEFLNDDQQNIVVGRSTTIRFRLFDDEDNLYSGNVTATITDPDGNVSYYSVSGSQGIYSVQNVTLDEPGDYSLVIWDSSMDNAASGTLTATNATISTSGSLVINDSNPEHKVTVTLMEANGNVLPRESLTVDGTGVGVYNTINLNTDYNGNASFSMIPKTLGNIKFVYNGHVIGSMKVQPAYAMDSRIGGGSSSNTATSISVAQAGWSEAANVILTRDDILIDSMSAVPLSKRWDAPILMTPSAKLDPNVLTEIKNLGATTVFIVGGTVAVQPAVENELKDNGLRVIRVAGYDCYETAAKVAEWVGDSGTVYLANGDGVPDALAISPFAAEEGNSILLTSKDKLPDVTIAELKALAPKKVVIIGGTAVVSDEVAKELSSTYSVDRWAGWDRYGTQQIIFQNSFKSNSPLYITSSLVKSTDLSSKKPYADALLASALAAKNGGFVIAVPPNELPKSINTFLLYNKGYISESSVVGNNSAITLGLEGQIESLLAH